MNRENQAVLKLNEELKRKKLRSSEGPRNEKSFRILTENALVSL